MRTSMLYVFRFLYKRTRGLCCCVFFFFFFFCSMIGLQTTSTTTTTTTLFSFFFFPSSSLFVDRFSCILNGFVSYVLYFSYSFYIFLLSVLHIFLPFFPSACVECYCLFFPEHIASSLALLFLRILLLIFFLSFSFHYYYYYFFRFLASLSFLIYRSFTVCYCIQKQKNKKRIHCSYIFCGYSIVLCSVFSSYSFSLSFSLLCACVCVCHLFILNSMRWLVDCQKILEKEIRCVDMFSPLVFGCSANKRNEREFEIKNGINRLVNIFKMHSPFLPTH